MSPDEQQALFELWRSSVIYCLYIEVMPLSIKLIGLILCFCDVQRDDILSVEGVSLLL